MPNLASQMRDGVFQHRLEHRLQLARRAGDDLQHLRGRGLLLQRLGEIVGALAQLVEQPRVLDGDDGLGGEVLHQLDLLVGERPYLLAVDGECADQLVVLEHRTPATDAIRVPRGQPRRCGPICDRDPPLVRRNAYRDM